jgi:hypothetical protein
MSGIEYQTTADFGADRFAKWPLVLAFSFPLLLIILWIGPFGVTFAGVPILIMVWACSALLALVMAILAATVHRWRQAFSLSVLPLTTLVVIVNAGSVWPFAIETGERIHFQIMRRTYLQALSHLKSTGEPRFAIWQWGGFVIGHAVVYDESDEILLSEHSAAWKERVANTEVGMCGAWGTPLGDHFYLVRTGC